MKARVTEKIEQAHLIKLLRSVGGRVYVLGTRRRAEDFQGTMQTPGIGDVYALLPAPPLRHEDGRPCSLWVEVKARGGRLRPEQAAFREQCLAAGVPHVVGGLDAVIAFLVDGGWLKANWVPHYRQPALASRETR